MPKITLPQKNMTLEVETNSNLMDELLKAGLPVASSCHGDGICSMCRVQIESAQPMQIESTDAGSKHIDESNLTKTLDIPTDLELNTLKRNKCEPNERLSCQIQIQSDLTIKTKYW